MTTTVLFIVFPLVFIIHDTEEIIVQHKWMLTHKESLSAKFPKLKPIIAHLAQLNTKSFAIAALEELVILLMISAYALYDGMYALQVWAAVFIAFSVHLLIHLGQATIIKKYVPGFISTLISLPFAYFGMQILWQMIDGIELLWLGLTGIIVMIVNLKFAHWLGTKLGEKRLE